MMALFDSIDDLVVHFILLAKVVFILFTLLLDLIFLLLALANAEHSQLLILKHLDIGELTLLMLREGDASRLHSGGEPFDIICHDGVPLVLQSKHQARLEQDETT